MKEAFDASGVLRSMAGAKAAQLNYELLSPLYGRPDLVNTIAITQPNGILHKIGCRLQAISALEPSEKTTPRNRRVFVGDMQPRRNASKPFTAAAFPFPAPDIFPSRQLGNPPSFGLAGVGGAIERSPSLPPARRQLGCGRSSASRFRRYRAHACAAATAARSSPVSPRNTASARGVKPPSGSCRTSPAVVAGGVPTPSRA